MIVRWKDDTGESLIGIIDGKSKSGGTVSHSDISDVAIDTHKEKNNANYVAIIGPGFSGDTIRNYARKRFALISDTELIGFYFICSAKAFCELPGIAGGFQL